MDSVDLLPYLQRKNKGGPHTKLFWRVENGAQYAVRVGDWKLVKTKDKKELFNLKQDIGEQTDLSAQNPDILQRLDDQFAQWNTGMIPPVFAPLGAKRKE